MWEKARVGWSERIALKHVCYHVWNRLPIQGLCMRQGAQGWCTGMTLTDGMGREVGGGSGWGTHVHPWLIHANVWQNTFSLVQFSHSVMSDSLRPHESQHTRPPCPSPTPSVYSNSCPSSRWCHPAISSSVVPFSSCPQSLPASGSFPMSQLFT